MTEGERIKELRSILSKSGDKMTLEKFGNRLGVGKSAISDIERGRNALSDQMARAISREFGVREEWLRTGEGDPFVQKSRSEQIRSFVDEIEGLQDSFKRRFVAILAELNEQEWEILEKAVRIFAEAVDDSEEAQAEAEIRRELRDYEQELRLEKEAGGRSEASNGSEGRKA